MKAKRIIPGQSVNPTFSSTERLEARAAGRPYDNPEFLEHPIGEIVVGPDAWRLCVLATPAAVPADAECKAAVDKWRGDGNRLAFVRSLIPFLNPDVLKQLGKVQRERVESLLEVYGDDAAKLAAEDNQTPAE